MKRASYLLILFGCLLSGSFQPLAAQAEGTPTLSLKARAFPDSIVLRWVPGDYDTWRLGMERGYRIQVSPHYDSGEVGTGFLLDTIIYPKAEGRWGDLRGDEYLGLAHALLYDFSQSTYRGAQGAFTQRDDRINRHGFMLFTADISLQAAQYMGLSMTITGANPNREYDFIIEMVDEQLRSNPVRVDPALIEPLPLVDSLHIRFHDRYFDLAWLKSNLSNYYTYYDIEYSTNGGRSFEVLNEKPFVYLEDESLPEAVREYIFYRDSIDNYVEYLFRVRGHTPFGEYGPYSATVGGQGQPDPFPMLPRITEVTELVDETFRLQWTVSETYADSVVGYNVLRYENYPGEPVQLNAELLDPGAATFVDESPLPVNFYQLEVIDVNENRYLSPTALAQARDSVPPAPPTNLVGVVDTVLDSIFIVRLSWDPNPESDLSGYRVFNGNGRNGAFASLTNETYRDTVFFDTLPVATLAEETFYKVRAVDFRGNISDFSEVAQLDRPDLIPPVPPVLNRTARKSAAGINLEWINSSSKDVVSYQVERKIAYSGDDWVVVETRQKNNRPNDALLDDQLNDEIVRDYWYRVKVIDDADLFAYSDTLTVKPVLGKKRMSTDLSFGLGSTREEKSILLYWQTEYPPEAEKVVILRTTDEGRAYTLAQIPIAELGTQRLDTRVPQADLADEQMTSSNVHVYRDFFVETDRTYLYKIQLLYANGERSNLSQKTVTRF